MSTLREDDLFLVNREGESYTIEYGELLEQVVEDDSFWERDGGKLYPKTVTDDVLVGGADAAAAKIQLNTDGSATFKGDVDMAGVNTSTYQTGVRAETNSGNTVLTVYGDSTNDSGAFVVYDGQATDKTRVSINNNGSATFAGTVSGGAGGSSGTNIGLVAFAHSTESDGGQYGAIYAQNSKNGGRNFIGAYHSNGSSITSEIFEDGSATFASTITAGGFRIDLLNDLPPA